MVLVAAASSPPVLGMLAHDLRWTIVSLLADGDLRTGELVARTGQAPSLVSYHLGRLRDAGLVSVRRSTADGRDSYHVLDLDAVGQALGAMAADIHPCLLADIVARDPARDADMPNARAGLGRPEQTAGGVATGGSAVGRSPAYAGCEGRPWPARADGRGAPGGEAPRSGGPGRRRDGGAGLGGPEQTGGGLGGAKPPGLGVRGLSPGSKPCCSSAAATARGLRWPRAG